MVNSDATKRNKERWKAEADETAAFGQSLSEICCELFVKL